MAFSQTSLSLYPLVEVSTFMNLQSMEDDGPCLQLQGTLQDPCLHEGQDCPLLPHSEILELKTDGVRFAKQGLCNNQFGRGFPARVHKDSAVRQVPQFLRQVLQAALELQQSKY